MNKENVLSTCKYSAPNLQQIMQFMQTVLLLGKIQFNFLLQMKGFWIILGTCIHHLCYFSYCVSSKATGFCDPLYQRLLWIPPIQKYLCLMASICCWFDNDCIHCIAIATYVLQYCPTKVKGFCHQWQ